MTTVLHSELDASINFVKEVENGMFESRFVQRTDDYFICYLSSHAGCNKACRFCFLTQTGQTSMQEATASDLHEQAVHVLMHYATKPTARKVHFNFMARGEPFASKIIRHDWRRIYDDLSEMAAFRFNLDYRFNISTILPPEFMAGIWLDQIRHGDEDKHRIYYSLYSTEERFRRRWLPRAAPVDYAIKHLLSLQAAGVEVALHHTFIDGENDSVDDVNRFIEVIQNSGLTPKFNLVRYNPYSPAQGKESPEEILQRNFEMINTAFGREDSHIVPRVGFDVHASCGCFFYRE